MAWTVEPHTVNRSQDVGSWPRLEHAGSDVMGVLTGVCRCKTGPTAGEAPGNLATRRYEVREGHLTHPPAGRTFLPNGSTGSLVQMDDVVCVLHTRIHPLQPHESTFTCLPIVYINLNSSHSPIPFLFSIITQQSSHSNQQLQTTNTQPTSQTPQSIKMDTIKNAANYVSDTVQSMFPSSFSLTIFTLAIDQY